MFKRANKITALLVAAASVMSIVPAMAADATRLGNKSGTIKQAIAFDDSKNVYEGYKTDDQVSAITFNDGTKEKVVEDLEDYKLEDAVKYGSKYAYATKGSDQYLVDLTTGKVVDDETAEEKQDSAVAKLRTTLKKASRYEKTADFRDINIVSTPNLRNQFGDVWYQYKAPGEVVTTTAPGASAVLTIALPDVTATTTSQSVTVGGVSYAKVSAYESVGAGQFITAADLEAKVQADAQLWLDRNATAAGFTFTSSNATEITFTAGDRTKLTDSNINDLKAKYGSSSIVKGSSQVNAGATLNYQGFLNSDGKYVDASYTANMYVYSSKREKFVKVEKFSTAVDKNENVDDAVKVELVGLTPLTQDKDYLYVLANVRVTDTLANTATDAKYLQKISKTQGDKPDGAYIPKTVDSYLFDDKSIVDSGDVNDVYTAMFKVDDGYDAADNQYRVKGNTLYITRVKADKVKITKAKMTQIKEKLIGTGTGDTKYDAYVMKKDGDPDHDIFKGAGSKAVSMDVDGNTWILDKGSIYKFDGSNFKEMFTVDRSIDNLDVYNDGNLIAWENNGNDDGKVYTTVQEGTKKTQDESTAVAPVIKTNWDKNADGSWSFYDQTGAKVVSKWINVGGVWYYLKADGIMATGWYNDNGTWYYLQGSGAMSTGWLNDNGTWYYLAGSGAMLANTTVDGYVLGASGAWIK